MSISSVTKIWIFNFGGRNSERLFKKKYSKSPGDAFIVFNFFFRVVTFISNYSSSASFLCCSTGYENSWNRFLVLSCDCMWKSISGIILNQSLFFILFFGGWGNFAVMFLQWHSVCYPLTFTGFDFFNYWPLECCFWIYTVQFGPIFIFFYVRNNCLIKQVFVSLIDYVSELCVVGWKVCAFCVPKHGFNKIYDFFDQFLSGSLVRCLIDFLVLLILHECILFFQGINVGIVFMFWVVSVLIFLLEGVSLV